MTNVPSVIDLFAGVGGLSLGAARAGFNLLAAVENDPIASSTHKLNFPSSNHFTDDIRDLKGSNLLSRLGLQLGGIMGQIGGPPCQGFSNIGKREKNDHRNDLFYHFFRLVEEMRPAFFVAENVPGILHTDYIKLRRKAFSAVRKNYVLLRPLLVKASDYGVPTVRARVFFIGFDPKRFPKKLSKKDFLPPTNAERITVKTALTGLPESISSEWLSEEEGWRNVTKTNGTDFMHKIVGEIPEGVGDETAVKRYKEKNEVSGCLGTRHLDDVVKRFEALEYGKSDKISRGVRLDPDGFCPTLRAGTNSDRGSYQAVRPIHPEEPRVITPREAARLQGFPDWFVFHPTKWHSFRQIGNSVSPIVAEYLLKKIFDKMETDHI